MTRRRRGGSWRAFATRTALARRTRRSLRRTRRTSTGSLRASGIVKSSPLVQRARRRADLPKELPCMATFWSACANSGCTSPRSTSARRMSTIAPIGSIPAGQRSTHARHVVHCQTPSGRLIHARTSSRSLGRDDSSERAAATYHCGRTSEAGRGCGHGAGRHADRAFDAVLQAYKGMVAIGPRRGGTSLTRMSGCSSGKRS